MKPIMNVDDVALTRYVHGDEFDDLDGPIGASIGARQLGCSLSVVPPGKRAWPFHCHHVNEELVFVIEGRGTLRIGDEEHPIRKGDVIAFPAGGSATAHQIVNSSQEELRYLSVTGALTRGTALNRLPHRLASWVVSVAVARFINSINSGCARLPPTSSGRPL